MANPHRWYDIDCANPDIHIGDKAPDGSQLRPYVIYFGEDIERTVWKRAVEATKSADIFVVVGSTLLVFPAADLLKMIPANYNSISLTRKRCSCQTDVITNLSTFVLVQVRV